MVRQERRYTAWRGAYAWANWVEWDVTCQDDVKLVRVFPYPVHNLQAGACTSCWATNAEDIDGQGHNPFMVRQVWSKASTVQLVSGGSAAVQCLNSKAIAPLQERSYKLTCNWAHGAMIAGHPTSCLLWMVSHNPTCLKKGCWSVSPLTLIILLWTSGRGTWIFRHLYLDTFIWYASKRAQQQTLHLSSMVRPPYQEGPGHTFAIHPS